MRFPRLSTRMQSASLSQPAVKSLHVYPVKSCGGIDVRTATMKPRGFDYDRTWVVVQEKNMQFLTQRQIPKMALVDTHLPEDVLNGSSNEGALVLSVPGKDPIEISLQDSSSKPQRRCKVWEWEGLAQDEGDSVARWLSDYLGRPARLIRYIGDREESDPSSSRPTNSMWFPGHDMMFADDSPYLIATQASLDDLNKHLDESTPVPMNRFRPNIVLDQSGPWEEDMWSELHGEGSEGSWVMKTTKPCSRCKIITVEQSTADITNTALLSLMKFRTGKLMGWDDVLGKNDIFFGWHGVADSAGQISVGDKVGTVRRTEKLRTLGPEE